MELEVGNTSMTHRITNGASFDALIKRIAEYEPTQKELDELEEAMRKGSPDAESTTSMKTKNTKSKI